ncbi:hypothetical protein J6590_095008 [Homalodisca vitripennis]|nr:hypothetical protein J6590_095396 [Homalodisca vitripennis]KAG8310172.1 hypothetical protein J6590_068858 [Homalodisca vitripennis]KAG8314556.1 hypothetical protein J6590_090511 [Homalodisca vitripennis]KAG8319293.1 hypothetical protein J6590_095008 [Homalodisca vitripennis]
MRRSYRDIAVKTTGSFTESYLVLSQKAYRVERGTGVTETLMNRGSATWRVRAPGVGGGVAAGTQAWAQGLLSVPTPPSVSQCGTAAPVTSVSVYFRLLVALGYPIVASADSR